MIETAFILPTGDEIMDGTVLDLDCPEIMRLLVKLNPRCRVTRVPPAADVQEEIIQVAEDCMGQNADLLVLVGGSGGGHRHSATLGRDYTHSALELWLDEKYSRPIYGKNGHLWSNLVCGRKGNCLVVNVPGPLREASAAMEAFVGAYAAGADLCVINEAMAEAVFRQYPVGARYGS